jgi:MFS family permease
VNRRWLMLAVIFLARISMGFQFQSIAAVSPFLAADLHLTHAHVGTLLGLYLLPGAVIALPGGALGQRFGARAGALIGLCLMAIGAIVIARSPDFLVACLGRLVGGTGGVLMNVLLAKMVADWFTGREISAAMGVMLTAWPIGMALALGTLGQAAEAVSWRVAIDLTAGAALVGLALLISIYRDPPGAAPPAPARIGRLLTREELRLAVVAGLGWGAYNSGIIVFAGFAPGFLMARGDSPAVAGALVSLVLWVTLVAVPAAGIVTDRTGRVGLMIVGGAVTAGLGMVALTALPGPLGWLVAIGIVGSAPAAAYMTLLPRHVAPQHLAAALGVYYSVFYLCQAIAPAAAGGLRDVTGSAAAPILFAALVIALTGAVLPAFRRAPRVGHAPHTPETADEPSSRR